MVDADSDLELYEYMEKRGICDENISKMREEKIDAAILLMMDDTSLQEFVPILGDRIALRNFCTKMQTPQSADGSSSKKDTLLQKLRVKLGIKQTHAGEEGSSNKSVLLKGNRNASKENRKIDIGWIDFNSASNSYKQVRKQTGGGTRQLSVSKTMGYAELLEIAKGLFFKDNISSKGHECEFEHDLCDFRQQPLASSVNVGQLYSETKMPTLRFYLRTKKIEHWEEEEDSKREKKKERKRKLTSWQPDSSEEQDFEDFLFVDPFEVPGNEVEIGGSTCTSQETWQDEFQQPGTEQSDILSVSCSPSEVAEEDTSTQTVSFGPRDSPNHQSQLNDTIPSTSFDQGSCSETSHSKAFQVLIIRRIAVVEDMINSFSSPEIMNAKISVHMVLPNGDLEAGQGSGVYQDALTQFWEEFFAKFTVGDIQKVPIIRHDYKEEEWQAVGRILTKGWLDNQYFPLSLSPIFTESAVFGSTPSNADSKSAFLAFVPESERTVLINALEDFPVDTEELLDILGEYDCRTVVNKENLPKIMSEMGFKELFQKPKCIADFMQPVLKPLCRAFTKAEFLKLYEELKPSPKKVISRLQFPPHSKANEATVATYLKRYVRSLSECMLKKFLRYCTASDVHSEKAISVIFTTLDGFERRPIAHTCGCVLEVPLTYESFVDMRQEFNEILESGVWIMDVV